MEERNLLTIDVEDWTSSSLFLLSKREALRAKQYLSVKDPQVEKGVRRIIDLLEEKNFKATFFVLGQTAKIHKELIRLIHSRGHEVASHSMSHALLTGLSNPELVSELKESKKLLEDILGVPVLGFRAPNLTSFPDVSFFYAQLQEAGYSYDSSFTTDTRNPGPALNTGITEIPVTVVRHLLGKVPLGGMYLKLMPPSMVSRYIKEENHMHRPAVLYIHPYELSGTPICWPHPSPSLQAKFSLLLRNTRKGHHIKVLNHLFKHHHFTSIKEYLLQKQ